MLFSLLWMIPSPLYFAIISLVHKDIKQLLFFLSLDVLLIFTLLFAETFLGVYVIALFVILFILNIFSLDFKKIMQYKEVNFLWLLFLFGLLTSALFTKSIPLTISTLIFYFFSYLFFIFFLLHKKTINFFKNILIHVFLVFIVINCVSLVFFIFPGSSLFLPGMNLIYPSYGHNHLGALSIIFVPLAYYYLLGSIRKKHFQQSFLFLFTLFFIFLNLLLSFGRVVILLGFIEAILITFLYSKDFVTLPKLARFLYFSFIGLYSFSVIFLASITVFMNIGSHNFCQQGARFYHAKICKDVLEDPRSEYWGTAIRGIQDNFYFGYGPGTYRLIQTKYKEKPEINSSYAHNVYLQTFAEGGIVVFVPFVLLALYLLIKSVFETYKKQKNNKNSLGVENFILMGVFAIYIDVLLDFDWSFLGIFIITLLFIALLLRKEPARSLKHAKQSIAGFITFLVISLAIVIVATFILLTDYLIEKKELNKAMHVFPFYQSHMRIFSQFESSTDANKDTFFSVYKYHPEIYVDKNNIDLQEARFLTTINPWHFYTQGGGQKMEMIGDQFIKDELVTLYKRYEQSNSQGYALVNQELAQFATKIADKALLEKQIETASQYYHLAVSFDPWVWNNTFPGFNYSQLSLEEKYNFWNAMADISGRYFYKHQEEVAMQHTVFLDDTLKNSRWDEFKVYLERIREIAPWISEAYLLKKQITLQEMADSYQEKGDDTNLEKVLEIISLSTYSYWGKPQLAHYFLSQGNFNEAEKYYQVCLAEWSKYNKDAQHADCLRGLQLVTEQTKTDVLYQDARNALLTEE